MNEMLDSIPLECVIKKINVPALTKKELEQLDQDITFVPNKGEDQLFCTRNLE